MAGQADGATLRQRENHRVGVAARAATTQVGSRGMDVQGLRRMASGTVTVHLMVPVVTLATTGRDCVADRRDVACRTLVLPVPSVIECQLPCRAVARKVESHLPREWRRARQRVALAAVLALRRVMAGEAFSRTEARRAQGLRRLMAVAARQLPVRRVTRDVRVADAAAHIAVGIVGENTRCRAWRGKCGRQFSDAVDRCSRGGIAGHIRRRRTLTIRTSTGGAEDDRHHRDGYDLLRCRSQ
jgi:hypothetical protein